MEFTEEEYVALARYQDEDYRIINSLLRRGFSSEAEIDNLNTGDYPFLTRDDMNSYLSCISLIYSAILRTYQANGCVTPNKTIYRGTQTHIAEAMDGEECSFLSTTTSLSQTRCFSAVYTREGFDGKRRAVALIDGHVPWINIDELMGGMEDDFLPIKAGQPRPDGFFYLCQERAFNISKISGQKHHIVTAVLHHQRRHGGRVLHPFGDSLVGLSGDQYRPIFADISGCPTDLQHSTYSFTIK